MRVKEPGMSIVIVDSVLAVLMLLCQSGVKQATRTSLQPKATLIEKVSPVFLTCGMWNSIFPVCPEAKRRSEERIGPSDVHRCSYVLEIDIVAKESPSVFLRQP